MCEPKFGPRKIKEFYPNNVAQDYTRINYSKEASNKKKSQNFGVGRTGLSLRAIKFFSGESRVEGIQLNTTKQNIINKK